MEADSLHVLVVTDDPTVADRVDELVRSEGRSGASATRVDSAQRLRRKADGGAASRWSEGVVLVDLAESSYDVEDVEWVADELGAPVVALTPRDDGRGGEEALSRGAQDYVALGEDPGGVVVRALRRARERQRLRNEVRSQASLLESTLESVTEGVLVVDLDGNVVQYNDRFQAIWGLDDELVEDGDDEELLDEAMGKLEDPEAFRQGVEELYENPEESSFDLLTFSDGRVVERYSQPRTLDGEVVGRVWTFRDVTERERTEEALRASEERFRSLYENATIGLYRTTPEGDVVLANPALVDMLGYDSFEELSAKNLETGPYHPSYTRGEWRRRLEEEGEVQGLETTWRTKDGEAIRVRESARVVRDDEGNVRYYEGTVEDVTDRWEAELELERRNELLTALHDVSLQLLEQLDVDDVLEEIVERASDLLGTEMGWIFLRSEDEDVMELRYTTGLLDEFQGLELERGEGHAGVIWEEGEPLLLGDYDAWERRAADFPEGILATVAGIPLTSGDEIRGVLGVARPEPEQAFDEEEVAALERFAALASVALENARLVDDMEAEIRERRETEEALRRSEERYRSLVDAAPDVIYTVDLDGTIESVNPAFEEITGWPPDEWEGRSFDELIHPDDRELAWEKVAEVAEGKDPVEAELRFRTREGGAILAHLVGSPRIVDGEVQGLIGIGRDVTERKERERRLAESQRRLQRAQAVGEIGDWTWDAETGEVEMSRQMLDLWGIEGDPSDLDYEDAREWVHPDDREDVDRLLSRAAEEGRAGELDHRIEDPDGSVRWIRTRCDVDRDEDGEVVGVRGTCQDVTGEKESQRALEERTRRLETLISNLPGLVYRCRVEPGWPMLQVEGECEELTGYPQELLEGDETVMGEEVVHPEDRERLRSAVADALESGEHFELVYRIVTADGETKWVWERGRGLYGDDGEADVVEGFMTDITERKEAEERLRQSEARYRNLVEAAPDVIYTLDPDGTIRSLNQAFEDITGWPTEEWEGRHFLDLVVEEDRQDALETFEKLQRGESVDVELRFRTRDGGRVVGDIVGTALFKDGEVHRLVGVARDVTERREAEERLRQSEARYRRLVESAPDPIVTLEPDGVVDAVNPAWEEETGWSREDLGDSPFQEIVHEDDRRKALRAFDRVLDGERVEIEMRIRTADGGTFWGHAVGVPLYEDGDVEQVLGVVRNITERKEAEERLRTVKNFNQTLLENAPVGIAHVAEDGSITYRNRELRRIREEILGEPSSTQTDPVTEAEPVAKRPELRRRVEDLLGEGQPFAEHQAAFEGGDGHDLHLAVTGVPLETGAGEVDGAILLARDVTEERELEREVERQTVQLIHSEKMAALGHLVAGIAHEINNPLSALKSNTELMKESTRRLQDKEAAQAVFDEGPVDPTSLYEDVVQDEDTQFLFEEGPDILERNLDSLERISDFIDSLRTFASPSKERSPQDLNAVLEDTTELFLAQYREEVDLTKSLGDVPPVPCDGSQIGQVVMNLLLNAAQASAEDAPVWLRSRREGDEAVVEVEDRGEGIPPGDRARIFDPFFTTKEDDNMGLGLSITDQIVTDHGGTVDVESTVGEGTRFEIRLPLEEGDA